MAAEDRPELDPEIAALETVLKALLPLDGEARQRVLRYVIRRFGLADEFGVEP